MMSGAKPFFPLNPWDVQIEVRAFGDPLIPSHLRRTIIGGGASMDDKPSYTGPRMFDKGLDLVERLRGESPDHVRAIGESRPRRTVREFESETGGGWKVFQRPLRVSA
jgi:hypothetical protein